MGQLQLQSLQNPQGIRQSKQEPRCLKRDLGKARRGDQARYINPHQVEVSLFDPNRATGKEKVVKIKKWNETKRKLSSSSSDSDEEEEEEDSDSEELPLDKLAKEQTRAVDGALITNFEIKDEEDSKYAGGLKGIRALRKQREETGL